MLPFPYVSCFLFNVPFSQNNECLLRLSKLRGLLNSTQVRVSEDGSQALEKYYVFFKVEAEFINITEMSVGLERAKLHNSRLPRSLLTRPPNRQNDEAYRHFREISYSECK
jgi:hypothetical protein